MTVSFTNVPVAEAPRDGGPIVRVVGPRGTDIANYSGYQPFAISPDGGFYVPSIVADLLCSGVAGFVRAPLSQGKRFALVSDAIAALDDGELKTALRDLNQLLIASYICALIYWVYCFAQKEAERREFTPQMQNMLLAVAGVARAERSALANTSTGMASQSKKQ